jgi:hypothetical protein
MAVVNTCSDISRLVDNFLKFGILTVERIYGYGNGNFLANVCGFTATRKT